MTATLTNPTRVLLLEDSPADAELITRELRKLSFPVETRWVTEPDEYALALREFRPEVILSDHSVPAFSGHAALDLARELAPGVPLILVTASLSEEYAVDYMKAGAADYVIKDRMLRLAPAVQSALERTRSIRESEERYRSLFLGVPVGLFRTGVNGEFIDANPALVRLLGYSSPAELAAADTLDWYVDPADRERWRELLDLEGSVGGFEIRLRRRDGRQIWVRESARAVRGPSGAVQYHEGMIEDITQKKEAEETLRHHHAILNAVIEGTPDAIFVKDLEGRYLLANSAEARLLGRSVEDILGKRDRDLCPPEIAREIAESDRQVLDSGIMQTHELELMLQGEPRAYLSAKGVFRDPAGNVAGVFGIARDITDRKRAADGLRDSQARLAGVLESAMDAIITVDHTQQVILFNTAAERMFGCSAVDAVGKPLDQFLTQRPSSAQADVSTGAGPVRGVRVDGSEFPIEASFSQTTVRGEEVFTAIIRDTTERTRAEEAQVERARLAALAAEVGLALTRGASLREVLQRCSEATVRCLDVARARIWTLNEEAQTLELQASAGLHSDLVDPDSRIPVGQSTIGRIAQASHRHLTNAVPGDPQVDDLEWAKREGMVAFAGYPLIVEDRVVGVFAFCTRRALSEATLRALGSVADEIALLIERKRIEEDLREREALFSSLANASPLGIVRADPTGRWTYANPKWSEISGLSLDATLGEGWTRVVHPEDAQALLAAWSTCVGEGRPHESEFRVTRPDGGVRMVYLQAAPIGGSGGAILGYVGTVEDTTQRKNLEEQFRQAQKMEGVGQLAGGVAHDFNNVLTAIIGYSEFMLGDLAPDDRHREDVTEIRTAAQRAAGLTRQLLAFSRQQVLQPTVLRVNEVVENVETMLRRLIGEDIELRTVLATAAGNVRADAGQLEQVIVNLVVNARDAMPTGGKLTIETTNAELSEDYAARHQPLIAGQYVMLAVSDTGVGINLENRSRIFEPFFTTKEKGKGSGLGLSTVYGIVKQSDGCIWVYSEPGQGTSFKIYLPRVDALVESPTPARELQRTLTGTETVLLAEDDDQLRRLSRGLLGKLGYQVLEAANVEGALRQAREHQGPIHLLLTDVVMPGESGRLLAQRLAEPRPETRVLYMSGYSDAAVIHHGVLDTGLNYLQKPFTPSALARRVREALDAE